jgi:hypothetical protein
MTSSELEMEMAMQLVLTAGAGGIGMVGAFDREFRFGEHLGPKGRKAWYRFDFAWPDLKIALEVEGGTWQTSRHTTGSGFEKDCEKYNEAACAGWTVLRVTGSMVHDGRALEYVRRALALI